MTSLKNVFVAKSYVDVALTPQKPSRPCITAYLWPSSETQGQIVGTRESLNGRKNIYGTKKSKEGREEPLGQWARSIQPRFPDISMDRYGPTGKVLRWATFPGRTGFNFGWMDRAQCLTRPVPNGRRHFGFWLVAIRSQNGGDRLELVS